MPEQDPVVPGAPPRLSVREVAPWDREALVLFLKTLPRWFRVLGSLATLMLALVCWAFTTLDPAVRFVEDVAGTLAGLATPVVTGCSLVAGILLAIPLATSGAGMWGPVGTGARPGAGVDFREALRFWLVVALGTPVVLAMPAAWTAIQACTPALDAASPVEVGLLFSTMVAINSLLWVGSLRTLLSHRRGRLPGVRPALAERVVGAALWAALGAQTLAVVGLPAAVAWSRFVHFVPCNQGEVCGTEGGLETTLCTYPWGLVAGIYAGEAVAIGVRWWRLGKADGSGIPVFGGGQGPSGR